MKTVTEIRKMVKGESMSNDGLKYLLIRALSVANQLKKPIENDENTRILQAALLWLMGQEEAE
jgi:hypothetical protein